MGDVVKKEGNLFGDGVNIAARLEALAQPNGISISKSVYDLVVPKTKMTFNDLGVQKVKQNEFHAFDILLDPSQKRTLKTKSTSRLPIIGAVAAALVVMVGVFYFNERHSESQKANLVQVQSQDKVLGKTILISPFQNKSGSGSSRCDAVGSVMHNKVNTGSAGVVPFISNGGSTVIFYNLSTNGSWAALNNSDLNANDEMYVSITYRAA